MSDINTGGPAFPCDPFAASEPKNAAEAKRLAEGMTLRQYAAIKLKVPDSGTDWLDEMITKSLRNDFAAKAMQAFCSDPDWRHNNVPYITALAAYEMADVLLKAREA